MLADTFDEAYKILVMNELSYINLLRSDKLNFMKEKLRITDLDSWTMMDQIYNFMNINWNFTSGYRPIIKNVFGEDRQMIAVSLQEPEVEYKGNRIGEDYHLYSPIRETIWRIDNKVAVIGKADINTLLSVQLPFYVWELPNKRFQFGWYGDYIVKENR